MGGVVSPGHTNDELVDNLCKGGYIVSPRVERVFRMIDRKDYMVFEEDSEDCTPYLEAYEDHAMKKGNLHLSAPCIYTKAMEAMDIQHGQSFLNLGSGTGYLSTMVGLLLGPTGINHGIEIFPDNIEFANEVLNKFKDESPWYDPVEFCEPIFIEGNALLLSPNGTMYDRIYCGAACPQEHVQLLKNILKINGILILPCENTLESVYRESEFEWTQSVVLSTVSFAPLILPSAVSPEDLSAITMGNVVFLAGEIGLEPHLNHLAKPDLQQSLSLDHSLSLLTANNSSLSHCMFGVCYCVTMDTLMKAKQTWKKFIRCNGAGIGCPVVYLLVHDLPRGAEVEWHFIATKNTNNVKFDSECFINDGTSQLLTHNHSATVTEEDSDVISNGCWTSSVTPLPSSISSLNDTLLMDAVQLACSQVPNSHFSTDFILMKRIYVPVLDTELDIKCMLSLHSCTVESQLKDNLGVIGPL